MTKKTSLQEKLFGSKSKGKEFFKSLELNNYLIAFKRYVIALHDCPNGTYSTELIDAQNALDVIESRNRKRRQEIINTKNRQGKTKPLPKSFPSKDTILKELDLYIYDKSHTYGFKKKLKRDYGLTYNDINRICKVYEIKI